MAIDRSTYEERLATFTAWPHASPKPQDLARAGLSYMPTKEHPDQVTCKRCNAELVDWKRVDDPMIEHWRYSNSCIRLGAKGEPAIMFVQDAMAPPPKHSQASSKDLQASTQKALPLQASPQKASTQKAPQPAPQPLPPLLAESLPIPSYKTSTFYERFATFTTAWPHIMPDAEDIANAGFIYQPTSKKPDNVICKICETQLCDWKLADDPMQKHFACSESCITFPLKSFPKMMMFVPDYMAERQEYSLASLRKGLQSSLKDQEGSSPQAPSQIAPQASPAPKPSTKDIGFLDPSLQHDFPELCLFHDAHVFCDRIEQLGFLGADILALLPKCLRGEALKWFNQSECQDLALCIGAMRARFSQALPQEALQESSQAPPQAINQIACKTLEYHHCKLCNASFSSMARLIRHTQENICNKPSCRHCDIVFSSKNQLHRHLREEYRKQTRSSSKSSSSPSTPYSSRSSSRSSPIWSSPSSTACSSACSPIFSPAPSPTSSPPPRYQAISPSPPNYLTVADLYARYAPQYLHIDDLFRMFGRRSARSSTAPTSARSVGVPTAPAVASKHSIRHRGRCQAKKGDGSTKPPKHLTKHLTKQQQNQKQKINFVRTSLQSTPYKSALPLQRSRSLSCPMAAPGLSSFLASSVLKFATCIRS